VLGLDQHYYLGAVPEMPPELQNCCGAASLAAIFDVRTIMDDTAGEFLSQRSNVKDQLRIARLSHNQLGELETLHHLNLDKDRPSASVPEADLRAFYLIAYTKANRPLYTKFNQQYQSHCPPEIRTEVLSYITQRRPFRDVYPSPEDEQLAHHCAVYLKAAQQLLHTYNKIVFRDGVAGRLKSIHTAFIAL
jgi:hypothetical protein